MRRSARRAVAVAALFVAALAAHTLAQEPDSAALRRRAAEALAGDPAPPPLKPADVRVWLAFRSLPEQVRMAAMPPDRVLRYRGYIASTLAPIPLVPLPGTAAEVQAGRVKMDFVPAAQGVAFLTFAYEFTPHDAPLPIPVAVQLSGDLVARRSLAANVGANRVGAFLAIELLPETRYVLLTMCRANHDPVAVEWADADVAGDPWIREIDRNELVALQESKAGEERRRREWSQRQDAEQRRAAALAARLAKLGVHTWATRDGKSFEAALVAYSRGTATLLTVGGEEIETPLAELDAASQRLLRRLVRERAAAPVSNR